MTLEKISEETVRGNSIRIKDGKVEVVHNEEYGGDKNVKVTTYAHGIKRISYETNL